MKPQGKNRVVRRELKISVKLEKQKENNRKNGSKFEMKNFRQKSTVTTRGFEIIKRAPD